MKKLLGFIACKMGFSCSSSNSRAFIDGWFLGSGITVKAWIWKTKAFGRHKWKITLVIHTRKDFRFGFSKASSKQLKGYVFSFWYGAIVVSKTGTTFAPQNPCKIS